MLVQMDTPHDDQAKQQAGCRRRGAGLRLRRAAKLLVELEQVFDVLQQVDKLDGCSPSVLIFLGQSMSKPREALEIAFPPLEGDADNRSRSCMPAFEAAEMQKAYRSVTRQMVQHSSQLPMPPTGGKVKLFLALRNGTKPRAGFDVVHEPRCSLKRCLTSVFKIHCRPHRVALVMPCSQGWLLQQCSSSDPLEQLSVCRWPVSGLTYSDTLVL
jgi:hypothetical protein